jgi:hypothetical protein
MDNAEINSGHLVRIRSGGLLVRGDRDLGGHIHEQLRTDVDQGDRTD